MKIYEFSLVLKNVDENTTDLEDSLYEAGCDDALINFRNGTVYLDFDRESLSFDKAVLSAIKDVESSSVKAIVASVAPEDLVTESEIAKRFGVERQAVLNWIKRDRRSTHSFPNPVMKLSGRSPLWKWKEVVEWTVKYHNNLKKNDEVMYDYDVAVFLDNINAALEERNPKTRKARQELVRQIENRA